MAVVDQALAQETATFEAHREELLAAHPGRYVLVRGAQVVDVFETEMDAIKTGYARFGLEPFLVKRIAAVDEPIILASDLLGP